MSGRVTWHFPVFYSHCCLCLWWLDDHPQLQCSHLSPDLRPVFSEWEWIREQKNIFFYRSSWDPPPLFLQCTVKSRPEIKWILASSSWKVLSNCSICLCGFAASLTSSWFLPLSPPPPLSPLVQVRFLCQRLFSMHSHWPFCIYRGERGGCNGEVTWLCLKQEDLVDHGAVSELVYSAEMKHFCYFIHWTWS